MISVAHYLRLKRELAELRDLIVGSPTGDQAEISGLPFDRPRSSVRAPRDRQHALKHAARTTAVYFG